MIKISRRTFGGFYFNDIPAPDTLKYVLFHLLLTSSRDTHDFTLPKSTCFLNKERIQRGGIKFKRELNEAT